MSYTVRLKKKAEKQLNLLPSKEKEKILEKLLVLKENPFPHGCEKLQGVEGYRLRAGDYRILYILNTQTKEVFIFRIKHRKEVYRW